MHFVLVLVLESEPHLKLLKRPAVLASLKRMALVCWTQTMHDRYASGLPCQSRLRISILKISCSRSICACLLIIKKAEPQEPQNAKKKKSGAAKNNRDRIHRHTNSLNSPACCQILPRLQFHTTSPSLESKPTTTCELH